MNELALYTSTELIDELAKRATFAGIIIRSDKELKTHLTLHQNWDITYSKLSAAQVHELLQDTVEHFRQLAETEANE